MSNYIILAFICMCIGALAGYYVCSYYKNRKLYFYELDNFVQVYLNKILFGKETIISIINEYGTQSKLLHIHLNEYISCKSKKKELSFTRQYLKENEEKFIVSIFELIGQTDISTQNSSIMAKKNELVMHKDKAEKQYQKNGISSIKLGLLGGLLLAVIFI